MRPLDAEKDPREREVPAPQEPDPETDLRHCRTQLELLLARMEELIGPRWQEQPKPKAALPAPQQAELVCRLLEDPDFLAARLHALYCRKLAYRYVMEEDLRQVQRHFPEENIGRLEDLGEEYFVLRENGMSPLVACAAALQLRRSPAPPPETGLVTQQQAGPKEYYTPAEVDRLTREQLRDPGVMAAVRYSMTRWKQR